VYISKTTNCILLIIHPLGAAFAKGSINMRVICSGGFSIRDIDEVSSPSWAGTKKAHGSLRA
jgi:hypothetical protein